MKKFFKNEFVKLLLIGLVINSLAFVFGTCYAKASGQIEYTSLPYKVQNRLNYDISVYAQAYQNFWGNPDIMGTTIYSVDWTNPYILAWSVVDGNEVWNHFMLPMISNPNGEYYSVDLNGYPYATFDTTQNYLSIQFDPGYWYHAIIVERSDGRIDPYGFNNTQGGMRISFFSTFSQPTFLNGGVYYWNTLDSQAPVLYTNTSDLIEPGDPIQPDWDDDLPNKPTKPTTPTPPTKPTINDVSDLADYLKDLFQWLINVIGLWFNYLSDLLEWLITKLSNTIKQGFENLYQNFVNFFKDFFTNIQTLITSIRDKIDYITQPISATIIYDNIQNTAFLSSVNSCKASLETFKNVFSGYSEPNTYTIALHLENLNGGIMGNNLTTQYFDLSVINPVKSTLRVFMWMCITFGLFINIIKSISNYLNGGKE